MINLEILPEDIKPINRAGEPNIWRQVADEFGIDVVIYFAKKAGGSKLDVPSYKRLSAPALDRDCRQLVR